jgi:alkaline phosphatase D
LERDLELATTRWDFSNSAAPVALAPGASAASVRSIPTPYEVVGGAMRPITDWARVRAIDPRNPPRGIVYLPDIEGFRRGKLADPNRALLGPAQETWLKRELETSRAGKTVWQVLGNQTIMARVDAPDLSDLPASTVAELERIRPGIGRLLQLTKLKPPFNLDAWDGYPAQRARLYDMFAASGANALVVTGESHSAWANELKRGEERVGAEFGTTSVTSPGAGDYFNGSGLDIGKAFVDANSDVRWCDPDNRGFLVLTLKKTEALAEFFSVSTVTAKDYAVAKVAGFTVRPEQGPGIGAIVRAES